MSRKIYISSDMSVDARLIEIGERSTLAALLWPWLLVAFDDWGRAEASTKRLKAQLFPMLAEVTLEVIEQALALYAEAGLIQLYEVDGRRYMAIAPDKWFSYQTHIRNEKRERDSSRYPAPPGGEIPPSPSPARNHAQTRENARNGAEPRASVRLTTPSPSLPPTPSLPPSSTLSPQGERETPNPNGSHARQPAHDSLSPSKSPVAFPDSREPPPNTDAELYGALVTAIGQAPTTRAAKAEWGAWLRQLAEARASPAQIAERCLIYRRRYGPEIPLTPRALVRQWDQLTQSSPGGAAHHATATLAAATAAAEDQRRAEFIRQSEEKQRAARAVFPELYANSAGGAGANGHSPPAAHIPRAGLASG